MRLEKKNIHMNKIVKSETVIFFVSREERIMDADNEIENIINQKEIQQMALLQEKIRLR